MDAMDSRACMSTKHCEGADSSGSSPRESGPASSTASRASPSSSGCLDQFAPMLPSNPVQQLPLLHTTACTSATVRVAAWLLDHAEGAEHAPAAAGGSASSASARDDECRNNLACGQGAAAGSASCYAGSSLAGEPGEFERGEQEDVEALLAGLAADAAEAAVEAAEQQQRDSEARQQQLFAREPATAGRRSFEVFMAERVQHADALNNYVASLY